MRAFDEGCLSRGVRVWIFAALLLLANGRLHAASVESSQPALNGAGLLIRVDPSGVPLEAGKGFGVSATLTNNTDSAVRLDENDLRLTVPPEVEGYCAEPSSFWYGILPSEDRKDGPNYRAVLWLKRGQQTSVRWSWRRSGYDCTRSPLHRLYRQFADYIFFVPGQYRLTITVKYVSDADPKENLALETRTMDIAAPEWVILFGAALGGLIAYVILPRARRHVALATKSSRIAVHVAGPVGAMLLSMMVTILLSRLSASEFLIRVTVSDFWGAIAIGFIGNYLGIEGLIKLAQGRGKAQT